MAVTEKEKTLVTDSLDPRLVNMTDVSAVIGFAQRICQAASDGGMFCADHQDLQSQPTVRHAAKAWIQEIERRIDRMAVGDALEVIGMFDIVHRIAYGRPARAAFINRYVMKAFEASIHGDRSVNEYTLFHQISAGIRRRDPVYLDRPLRWQALTIERSLPDLPASLLQSMPKSDSCSSHNS